MTKELKTILPTLLPKDGSWQSHLLTQWHTIIGPLSNKVRLEKISGDTLILGVYDACWLQELYLLSPLIINTINQNLDQPRIKNLRFKRSVARKDKPKHERVTTSASFTNIALTPAQQQALATIQDPQLKVALHNFLIRCHKENT